MEAGSALFESSHPFLFFDYFRIPYVVAPRAWAPAPDGFLGRVRTRPLDDGPPRLLSWPRVQGETGEHVASLRWGRYRLGQIPLFGRVFTDAEASGWLPTEGRLRRAEAITDENGRRVASIWRADNGNVMLPFDPAEAVASLWSERYTGPSSLKAEVRRRALMVYYLVRPVLPRSVQIAARRRFTRFQGTRPFPSWPVETALVDLYEWLFAEVVALAGRPVPWLAPWPNGSTWALVLTHDVESQVGYERMHLLREPERKAGLASSWNFVPLRYRVDDATVRALAAEGCEIGVHGLRHDGKDLGSLRKLRSRLPAMREYAARWGAVGFRAPATQRRWEWMPLLGFDYDSSYPDTDRYEPFPGGCCSYLPYMNRNTVELPITLPQDHTLFAILQHRDETVWIEKARHIRDRGGMALVITHPDYADDPRVVHGYGSLLREFRDDPSVWHAVPREVSAWWRRRAGSRIEERDGAWLVRGPAEADGRVRFALPNEPALSADRNDEAAAEDVAGAGLPP